eukprot:CAMPEP_0170149206 /NCGR_PEP_ID=MMETSP0033_2-20121228/42039_1 /TAXON_ID=195969 /ORGANISM="Dolichomastix tenuilepis, Strain CCMP3274" /LENGTH=619 /DNA_ID=CAMNT_0010386139 /DNA_START=45 /DNA_END=1904 /DNA_ORIENTATION=+
MTTTTTVERGDAETPITTQVGSIRKMLAVAGPESSRLLIGFFFLVLSAATTMALPLFVGRLLDAVAKGSTGALSQSEAQKDLDRELYFLIGTAVASGVTSGLRAWFFNSASERVLVRVQTTLFWSLLQQEQGFYDSTTSGALLSRLNADTATLKTASTTAISIFLRSVIAGLIGIGMMLWTSWRLTLLSCTVVPFSFVGIGVYSRFTRRLQAKVQSAQAAASELAADSLGAITTVKAFAREKREFANFDDKATDMLELALQTALMQSWFYLVASTLVGGALGLVFWYGGSQVIRGDFSLGKLQAFVLYALSVAASITGSMAVVASIYQAVGGSARVFELIEREPHIKHTGTLTPFEAGVPISAELQGIWFAYPQRPTEHVLKGVDLFIDGGSTLALVGPSGAGKSTVVALIERFYQPMKGQVRLAGTPLEHIERAHLHEALGLVAQEPVLFARTIRENMCFGVEDATEEEVEKAATQANAHAFVTEYPEKYETYVGERGVQLSGGQKQRVAVARALLANPRLLLLDEATSALDAESEHLVVEALERLMQGRTSIVIAHRLSTVRTATKVAVLDKGVVCEQGSHDALIASEGVYHSLVQRQLTAGPSAASLSAYAEEDHT